MADYMAQLGWESIQGWPLVFDEVFEVSGYEYWFRSPKLTDEPNFGFLPYGLLGYRRKSDGTEDS